MSEVPNLIVIDTESINAKIRDPAKAGISVMVGWGLREHTPHIWILDSSRFPRVLLTQKNCQEILARYDGWVSWNGLEYDEKVMAARLPELKSWLRRSKHVDLHALCCLLSAGVAQDRIVAGLASGWSKLVPTIREDLLGTGWGLDSVGKGTVGHGKTDGPHGAAATEAWNEGLYSQVITYCVGDVALERELYLHAFEKGFLNSTERGRIDLPREVLGVVGA